MQGRRRPKEVRGDVLPALFLAARLEGALPLARFAALLSPYKQILCQVNLWSDWQSLRKRRLPCDTLAKVGLQLDSLESN